MELIVTAYNINYGLKQDLLKKCDYLNDYSTLVGKVKEGIAAGLTRREAISNAVKYCLENGIMKGYLEFHSEEVFNMLALQWDKDTALQASYEDGLENGEDKFAKLLSILMQNNKQEDIQNALNDKVKRKELYKTYGIV